MSKVKDNVRMKWSEDCIKHFLEACIQEVNQIGRRNEGSLQRQSWTNVGKQLQEACNLEVTQKQMRNEYDHLKWKFFEWAYLKQTMPDRYNSETNSFNLTNEEWEDFLKDHPRAKNLRSSPLLFPDLCTKLYERAFSIGEIRWNPISKRPKPEALPISVLRPNIKFKNRTQDPSTHGTPKGEPLDSEDTHSSSEEGGTQNPDTLESPNVQERETRHLSAQCSESTTSLPLVDQERPSALNPTSNGERNKRRGKALTEERSKKKGKIVNEERSNEKGKTVNEERPKKKGRIVLKVSHLEEDMSNALKLYFKSHVGPSQDDCIAKLNRLGWEKNLPYYVAALGIFCEGPGYREGWMLLPTDNVELVQLWIASVGKKLGYL
ncbi:myb/SANT-like domain, Harbinger transposase-derived nuclease domain protein [Artemisia annua]|uniref:Myb/SANT-like domain, Harbinger transposase-derived nuclease domain protein n=1 Tax=Artemisia annua TaxID=35608 RepID=A0A2U1NNQ4_ARTAN|nr:myb/SANT-like domain, Harbinger transposase-derived nuclease domain protein [Artemisia annua]